MSDFKTFENEQPPMQRQAQAPQQEAGFCFRLFVRIVAVITGLMGIVLGLVSAISIHGLCIVAGIYIMLLGFLVILLEAPFCCQFLEITDAVSKWSERRPAWQKAIFYLVLPIVPFFFCRGVSQIFACLGIMVTGVLYGLVFIGKKGDAVKNAHLAQQQQQQMQPAPSGADAQTQDPFGKSALIP
ncbi:calcium channel flower homolog [Diadema antillarum]|uniref:calcium channel flower homolog n=1 Tax=Diadema antillarum TaxID=105358 RepID=UPI003A89D04E